MLARIHSLTFTKNDIGEDLTEYDTTNIEKIKYVDIIFMLALLITIFIVEFIGVFPAPEISPLIIERTVVIHNGNIDREVIPNATYFISRH